MFGRRTVQQVRRFVFAPFRPAPKPPTNPELRRANTVAGKEPVRPALSGLQVRRPPVTPRTAARRALQLGYRWQPSAEYRRRQEELRTVNQWLDPQLRGPSPLPPIFAFVEDTDLAPSRLQPSLEEERRKETASVGTLPADRRELEAAAQLHSVRMLQPRIGGLDREYLLSHRPVLPRQYRAFLLHSLYPRVAVGLVAAAAMALSVVWFTQLQQEAAVAAGRAHVVESAFQRELAAARAYGLDPRDLQRLARRAHLLSAAQAPSGPLAGSARLHFYRRQERAYRSLLRTVRQLERRALRYWTWREGIADAALVGAARGAKDMGLQVALPSVPACGTARCYQGVVAEQATRAAWLRQTTATLRVYQGAVAGSPDPATTAGYEVQKARSLRALVPAPAPSPVSTAMLDGMYASAAGPADYARVGALAHLEADALQFDLIRTLPARALVISTEDQNVTYYRNGKAVYSSPVATDAETPVGVFHIQAKQRSLPTIYWTNIGRFSRYRYGSLPDWMAFSSQAALQGAPWRSDFGAGSDAVQPAYAPSTPGSVDLPPAAADVLFAEIPLGTEVVIY